MSVNLDDLRPSRRRFIAVGSAALATLASTPVFAANADPLSLLVNGADPRLISERRLGLRHRHTGETVNVTYFADGSYQRGEIKRVTHLMRDHRTDQEKPIDPELLDLLYAIRIRLRRNDPFDVYSGYRSPSTNAMLRRSSRRVAKNSLHMHGMAVDVGLDNARPSDLAKVAWSMQRGGVGVYRRSSFVHLDVGPVRRWRS